VKRRHLFAVESKRALNGWMVNLIGIVMMHTNGADSQGMKFWDEAGSLVQRDIQAVYIVEQVRYM